ncbi:thioredoxin domain-containing protein [Streptomyces sp. Vc74B-19]|uniref:DsbA family protein n=1 Tax=unclassified Streptomyces TaxID=2593676 RepID=UPI001BFCB02B|nr:MULTISPECIES: thioredoxin domain-containing protein [unclassified Streptomyces]MBT3167737.1 thioredoxin domain-containing protein [Streptomyces sp. Vc74B-19]MDU0303078.1 thioredoxin domain-containing protein [Streptomyces sp. PAL114]
MAAVATAGALGLMLTGCGEQAPASTQAAENKPYADTTQLPEQLAADGTTIVVGDLAAPTKVRVYEDPRCPVVEEFENLGGASVLREMTVDREVRTEYTFASFRDDRLGGDGSKRAVNALRAALEAGKFVEYHEVLFRNQAEVESTGGFTTSTLLELANEVSGLRSDSFDQAVKTMKHENFVKVSQRAYDSANGDEPLGPGTPTVVINDKQVPEELYGLLFEESLFERLLTSAHQAPGWWKTYQVT